MNYSNPELVDQLASAYVLGTLTGGARRRFERLALEQPDRTIQEAIWRWERRLNPLAESVAPVTPRPQVWHGLRARLEGPSRPDTSGLWFWRSLAAALGIGLIAMLIPYFGPEPAPQPSLEQLALIQDDKAQPLWVVAVDLESGLVRTRAINTPARDVDRVFQLWLLPDQGNPQSVGLLPLAAGIRGESQLSPALVALLGNSQGLAVSIEPPGGSPTGLPTGPVVYTAPIVEL